MIYEVADIRIQPGQQAAFEQAIQHGVSSVIAHAQGFLGYSVTHSIETPERYLLRIRWETPVSYTHLTLPTIYSV